MIYDHIGGIRDPLKQDLAEFSNDRILCVHAPSGYSTRVQLARGRFFEGLQNYTKNKNKGNENKIILGDFNCTIDKMDRDGENKTKTLLMLLQFCPVKSHRG